MMSILSRKGSVLRVLLNWKYVGHSHRLKPHWITNKV